jgi:hypothetical protein
MAHPAPDPDHEEDSPREAAPPPRRGGPRPDWLVGADEGAAADYQRVDNRLPPKQDPPKLSLHQGPAPPAGARPAAPAAPAQPTPPASGTQPPAAPQKPVAWAAAGNSIPRLRVDSTLSESVPVAIRTPPSEPPPALETGLPGADDDGFPDDAAGAAPARTTRRPVVVLHEPWWIVALEALRSTRRVQIIVAVALVAAITLIFLRPKGEPGVSIVAIHHHPERYDGQTVRLKGMVGEVFMVGGSYAYYLHQGRDTMVVFTRTHVPLSRQRVTVVGSVSAGFLDGVSRQVLFEAAR